MATAPMISAEPAEVRTVLRTITWETYCRLAEENQSKVTRFAFFDGVLEIMTVSGEHEYWVRRIDLLVNTIAWANKIDIVSFGQATLRRNDLHAGMEPDACFFVRDAERMRRVKKLNLLEHPAPDVAVEVDITRSSIDKLPLFSALAIPEVWRFSGDRLLIYRRRAEGGYRRAGTSKTLKGITATGLTQLLADSSSMTNHDWIDHVRRSSAR